MQIDVTGKKKEKDKKQGLYILVREIADVIFYLQMLRVSFFINSKSSN